MKINDKVAIIISEPWGYTTPEGGNKFSSTILDKTVFNRSKNKNTIEYEDAFLLKVEVPFIIDGSCVNYVMAEYRNKKVNSNSFNIYYIPNEYVDQFQRLDTIIDKLKFIIIGSVQDLLVS